MPAAAEKTDWKIVAPDGAGWEPVAIDLPAAQAPARLAAWRQAGDKLRAIALLFDTGDVLVALGLLLLSRGCYLIAPAAGWAAPGAVLLWYALPQRPRFLQPKPPTIIQQPRYRPDLGVRDEHTR